MAKKVISRGPEETGAIAARLADGLPRGSLLLLFGGVGSGKTAFTRGFAGAFGLDGMVSSPTFTLMNEYKNGRAVIRHFDLYRLRSIEEVEEIGVADFADECDYCLVEWPEISGTLFDVPRVEVRFSMDGPENERSIEIERIKMGD